MKLDEATNVEQNPGEETVFLDMLRPLLMNDQFDVAVPEFLSRFAKQLRCARVRLGLMDNDSIKVCAVSQRCPSLNATGLRELAAAMEESVLQEVTLAYLVTSSDLLHIHIAHATLIRTTGLASILTAPLSHNGMLIGAVTLESSEPQVISLDQLGLIQLLVSHAGPLLKLKWSSGRPFTTRCKAAIRKILIGGSADGHRIRLTTAAALGVYAAAMLTAPAPQQVASQTHPDALVGEMITVPAADTLPRTDYRL